MARRHLGKLTLTEWAYGIGAVLGIVVYAGFWVGLGVLVFMALVKYVFE